MSIANYFNKLPIDAPLLISWKPSAEPPTKQTERSWTTKKNDRVTANCAQCFVLELHYCESVVFVSWFSYHCCFPSAWGVHILCYTWYPRMIPDAEKNVELLLRLPQWLSHLSLPMMSQPHCEYALALYINGDRQRWPSTFGVSQFVWRNNRKWVSGEWRIIGKYRFEMLHFDAELERMHN